MLRFLKNLLNPHQAPCYPSTPAPVYQRPLQTSSPPRPRPDPELLPEVADDRGIRKRLGKSVARGGEGVVYLLEGRPDVLVKIYHRGILADASRAARLREKITLMSGCQSLRSQERLAWPLVPLLSGANGGWLGYAMRRQPGISLRELCGNPSNFLRIVPDWHRQHLVRLCLDFLDSIEALSAEQTLPVDFNPSNFLVDTRSIRMHFIDCDGYQFQSAGSVHLAGALLPEMAAPEVMRRNSMTEGPISAESLRFSLGMLLFYILNLGNSPYRHRNGRDPVHNLMKGACALGRGAGCEFPKGSAYRIWSHLTFDMKSLFIRCFRDGHSAPSARPTLGEWRDALHKYNQALRAGHADASPVPASAKQPKP